MARPKTGDKRAAILTAATAMIAAHGLGASTSSIAKAAGIGEGSLFRYFATKDELLNELYRDLKHDMREAMTSGFPAAGPLKMRAHHIWDAYVSWGLNSPEKRRTMAQLTTSSLIEEQSRMAGSVGFEDVGATVHQVVERGRLSDLPVRFVSSLLLSMAETTIVAMMEDPSAADRYCAGGFEAFWSAAAKK